MKMSTESYAKFESRGYPEKTVTIGPMEMRDLIRAQIEWVATAKMGSRIVVTYARSLEDLGVPSRTDSVVDEFADALLAAAGDDGED